MRFLTPLLLLLTLSGCASWLPKFSAPADDTTASAETPPDKTYQPADPEFYKRAYEQGVRDTLQEYKGRMRAREEYVYEPPLVQEVDMPARIVGGTFYPAHKEKVIVRPGRWVQENSVPAPDLTRSKAR